MLACADGEAGNSIAQRLNLNKNTVVKWRKHYLERGLQCTDPWEVVAVVLIIVYRYRKNLFHGVKWSYELRGQLENFMHANTILMQGIELHERGSRE